MVALERDDGPPGVLAITPLGSTAISSGPMLQPPASTRTMAFSRSEMLGSRYPRPNQQIRTHTPDAARQRKGPDHQATAGTRAAAEGAAQREERDDADGEAGSCRRAQPQLPSGALRALGARNGTPANVGPNASSQLPGSRLTALGGARHVHHDPDGPPDKSGKRDRLEPGPAHRAMMIGDRCRDVCTAGGRRGIAALAWPAGRLIIISFLPVQTQRRVQPPAAHERPRRRPQIAWVTGFLEPARPAAN